MNHLVRRTIGAGYAIPQLGVNASALYLAVLNPVVGLEARNTADLLPQTPTPTFAPPHKRNRPILNVTPAKHPHIAYTMQLLTVLFLVAFTSAAAVPEPAHAIAQPVQRAEATTGPIVVEGLGEDSSIVITIPLVTAAPVANALRVATDPNYESSSSACTPASICFDGITCGGLRYGG